MPCSPRWEVEKNVGNQTTPLRQDTGMSESAHIFEFLPQVRRGAAFDRHGRPVPALSDGRGDGADAGLTREPAAQTAAPAGGARAAFSAT